MKVTVTPKTEATPVSIFIRGNVVQSENEIVLVTMPMINGMFAGVRLSGGAVMHATDWLQEYFTQFHGTITIDL